MIGYLSVEFLSKVEFWSGVEIFEFLKSGLVTEYIREVVLSEVEFVPEFVVVSVSVELSASGCNLKEVELLATSVAFNEEEFLPGECKSIVVVKLVSPELGREELVDSVDSESDSVESSASGSGRHITVKKFLHKILSWSTVETLKIYLIIINFKIYHSIKWSKSTKLRWLKI